MIFWCDHVKVSLCFSYKNTCKTKTKDSINYWTNCKYALYCHITLVWSRFMEVIFSTSVKLNICNSLIIKFLVFGDISKIRGLFIFIGKHLFIYQYFKVIFLGFLIFEAFQKIIFCDVVRSFSSVLYLLNPCKTLSFHFFHGLLQFCKKSQGDKSQFLFSHKSGCLWMISLRITCRLYSLLTVL